MKHLKKFNESVKGFENIPDFLPKEMIIDVRDILLELSDENWTIKDGVGEGYYRNRYFIGCHSPHSFKYSDIKDVIDRVKEYCRRYKYNPEILIGYKDDRGQGRDKILHDSTGKMYLTYHDIDFDTFNGFHDFVIEFNPLYKWKELNEQLVINDIINDLQDICLELQDEGFEISVEKNGRYSGTDKYKYINVNIKKIQNCIRYDDISETINRMKDFMSSNGYGDMTMWKFFKSGRTGVEIDEINTVGFALENLKTNWVAVCFVKQEDIEIGQSLTNESIMKHLKTYNESYNSPYVTDLPETIKQDIEDICLELKDIKFNCKWIQLIDFGPTPIYEICKEHLSTFNKITTEETIERIKDYMDKNGYITIVSYNGTDGNNFKSRYLIKFANIIDIKFKQK